jgi:hypothetical protein
MSVTAEGDSLKKGVSGLSNTFTVLTSGFDSTKLAVEFEGNHYINFSNLNLLKHL